MAKSERRVPTGAAVMQSAVTAALTRALFSEWARTGYGALSLEAVARRAGTGKAALYRRWPSKAAMVADRVAAIGLDLSVWPDTGALSSDVSALLEDFRRLLRRPLVRRILPDLLAEADRSADISIGVEHFRRARRAAAAALLQRAVERGEIRHDADLEIAIDLLAAPIYWRTIVVGGAVDDVYLARLADAILAAIGAL